LIDYPLNFPFLILLTGSLVALTMLVKPLLNRIGVPSLVGYLLLGFLLQAADTKWHFLCEGCEGVLKFLAKIGLITLLFRVGLESNLRGLIGQLRRASLVWIADVVVSGLMGFATAFYILHFGWVTSVIVATAFTATSVGVSVAVWEESDAIRSPNGQLLIDVAELDDISAVVLMAMLFSVLPSLSSGAEASLMQAIPPILGLFVLKLAAFGAFCFLLSQYVEGRITRFFSEFDSPPDPMLVVVAIGFIIASVSEFLGFSMAIGAFFAGLVFSRDPEAVKIDASFLPLYGLFSPFFFIGIGLEIVPSSLGAALGFGTILVAAAILAKLLADGIPLWFMGGLSTSLLVGVSMVPRAEIAMVIMERGLNLEGGTISPEVFGAMILVSAVTCGASPLVVRLLLHQWPQQAESAH